MFDYSRQTDEELSFSEDAHLEVYDTSDPDWILVGFEDEYGFVPANYIEVLGAAASESDGPAPPGLPNRPPPVEDVEEDVEPPQSPAPNPAAALAGIMNQRAPAMVATRPPRQLTPEVSDEEPPTPTLPTRPKSQSKSAEPATQYATAPASTKSPVGSPYKQPSRGRSVDDVAPRHSPGGFHMYNINEMVTVMGKRKKMPTTLGINVATGEILIAPEKARDGSEQKWTAEKMTHYSIEGKHVFLELVRPSRSIDFHAGAKDTAEEIVSALGELSGAVRAEGLREILLAGSGGGQMMGQILYDFMAQGDDEVTVAVGDEVIIVDDTKSEEWWQVKRLKNGKEGVVPSSYIEVTGVAPKSSSPGINTGKSIIEQNRLDEEKLAKESLKAARREDEAREVGPGVKLPTRRSSLSVRTHSNLVGQQRSNRDSRNAAASSNSKTSESIDDRTLR